MLTFIVPILRDAYYKAIPMAWVTSFTAGELSCAFYHPFSAYGGAEAEAYEGFHRSSALKDYRKISCHSFGCHLVPAIFCSLLEEPLFSRGRGTVIKQRIFNDINLHDKEAQRGSVS